MREWLVAAGLLVGPEGLLLVQNRRRNGSLDWSTPGGVIDEGETLLEGLSREVREETGLAVSAWEALAYEVDVVFTDLEMHLRVEAHVAARWLGSLVVDDPDGIVVDAAFLPEPEALGRMDDAPLWVAEPLCDWLGGSALDHFRYTVTGTESASMAARRR